MREQTIAQRTPPPSEPAKRWFLRPSAIGLIARSTGLFELDARAAIPDRAARRTTTPTSYRVAADISRAPQIRSTERRSFSLLIPARRRHAVPPIASRPAGASGKATNRP